MTVLSLILGLSAVSARVIMDDSGFIDRNGWGCKDFAIAPSACLKNAEAKTACPATCHRADDYVLKMADRLEHLDEEENAGYEFDKKSEFERELILSQLDEDSRRRLITQSCAAVTLPETSTRISCGANGGQQTLLQTCRNFATSLYDALCRNADCLGFNMECSAAGERIINTDPPTPEPTPGFPTPPGGGGGGVIIIIVVAAVLGCLCLAATIGALLYFYMWRAVEESDECGPCTVDEADDCNVRPTPYAYTGVQYGNGYGKMAGGCDTGECY